MSQTILQEGHDRKNDAGEVGAAGAGVRIRTVALPNEHGGWGLALEPVALGLLVAPSPAGFFLAVATLGAFLKRHPFKIVAGDRRRGRRFPRTAVAERFALLYACLALAGLLAAATTRELSIHPPPTFGRAVCGGATRIRRDGTKPRARA